MNSQITAQLLVFKNQIQDYPRTSNGKVQYPIVFKVELSACIHDSGIATYAASKVLGMHQATLHAWMKDHREGKFGMHRSVAVTRLRTGGNLPAAVHARRTGLMAAVRTAQAALSTFDAAVAEVFKA
jgi:transposase-like protein